MVGRKPFVLIPPIIIKGSITYPPSGISVEVDVWGRFSERGKKEADTIPVIEKKVPHVKILWEIVIEKNNRHWLGKIPCRVNNALHEGLTRGNDPTGKLKGPNKRQEVPQVANPFG